MSTLVYAFPRINFYIKFKTTCKISDVFGLYDGDRQLKKALT